MEELPDGREDVGAEPAPDKLKKLLDRYNVEHGIHVRTTDHKAETTVDDMIDDEKWALAAKLRKMGLMPPKTEESANSTKNQTESLPVFKKGAWDHLIHRYQTKTKSMSYPQRYLFDPITGRKSLIEPFPTLPGVEAYVRDTSVEI